MKEFIRKKKSSTAKLIMKNRATKLVTAGIIASFFITAAWAINGAYIATEEDGTFVKVAQVNITANGFEPATLLIQPGTKIVWTNSDDELHQVSANPHPTGDELPGLKSEILNEGQTYEFTADQNGEFGYHDYQNPTKNGTLIIAE